MAKKAATEPTSEFTMQGQDSPFTDEAMRLISSGYQAMLVQTYEPSRVVDALKHLRNRINEHRTNAGKKGNYVFVEWDSARGFTSDDVKSLQTSPAVTNPALALGKIVSDPTLPNAVVVLHNMHSVCEQTLMVRQTIQNLITDRALSNAQRKTPIFFVQPTKILHPDLMHLVQPLTFSMPNEDELGTVLTFTHRSYAISQGQECQPLPEELESALVSSMRGLSRMQAEDALSLAITTHNGFHKDMVRTLRDQKAKLVGATGVLQYIPDSQIPQLDDIRGFDACIPMIRRRALAYTPAGKRLGLDTPRGIALLGPPGTGKTQFAKLVARIFQEVCGQAFPTYWVNVGAIFGQYVGQSEANLEMVLDKLAAHRGCVAIFDEFEKTLGQGDSSHEVANRVRGRLLNWMQEDRGDTFVVPTMNSTTGIAPEFFRRFDETFYTDLPDDDLRSEILQVHLRKRGVSLEDIDLAAADWSVLSERTRGFVGSELEDVIINARLLACEERQQGIPTMDELLEAISDRERSIISKSNKEVLDGIQTFCRNIARPVHAEKKPTRSRTRNIGV